MPIVVARTAGFCFGVRRAMEATEALLQAGRQVALLGELIHNRQAMQSLCARGARLVQHPGQVRPGEVLVLRAHGITKELHEQIAMQGQEVCDCTCPFVKKIHNLVQRHAQAGTQTLLLGDALHPEVVGICSYIQGEVKIAKNSEDVKKWLTNAGDRQKKSTIILAQTTFFDAEWKKTLNICKKGCTNPLFFDTICNATHARQTEAAELAAKSEAMVIIGDRLSSNTGKLHAVCSRHCPSFLVEQADDVFQHKEDLQGRQRIGCTAGASTPARTIKEVLSTMSEQLEQEILHPGTPGDFEALPQEPVSAEGAASALGDAITAEAAGADEFSAALEESLSAMSSDQQVKGIVTAINASEIQVDIGRKQTGYIVASEYSNDPHADPVKELHVGDELDLIILKTNDAEGTVQLSKKRFDASRAWQDIIAAVESGAILEGTVVDAIKGGVLVLTGGMRIFVPGSLTGLQRNQPLESLKEQEVRFRIVEVNRQRRRAVGSIRAVLQEERQGAQDAFWQTAHEGQVLTGHVKSLVSYGAFVDIGGLDGMVHISELSWQRVKHPSDVLTVGQEVEVYIKSLDLEKKKISLGYRKASENPWEQLREQHPIGSTVEVTIVSFTAFGAFARVLPGVDGLIHLSQISNRRIEKPQQELQIGQTVQAKIINVDFEKRRVSLSIRALLEDEASPEAASQGTEEVVASSHSQD